MGIISCAFLFWLLPIFVGWLIGRAGNNPVDGIVWPLLLGWPGVLIVVFFPAKKSA